MAIETPFNEETLREEIARKWGEHGAHMEVFDYLLRRSKKLEEIEKFLGQSASGQTG